MNGKSETYEEGRRQEGLLRQSHELRELHRKLKGSLLQCEALMLSLDIPFKSV